MKKDLDYLLNQLLQKEGIPIDEKELTFQLLSHPSFPSLHSLTSVLDHFRVGYLALELPKTEEVLSELPDNFICQFVGIGNEEELLLIEKGASDIKVTNHEGSERVVSIDKFLTDWSGIVLLIDPDRIDESRDKKEGGSRKEIVGTFLFATILLVWVFLSSSSLLIVSFIGLSILGFILSVYALSIEFGSALSDLKKLCDSSKKEESCDDVVLSKTGKIIGGLSFSDLGVMYFSMLIGLGLLCSSIAIRTILISTAYAAIPIILYSLYLQFIVLKRKCNVCLFISSTSTMQIILSTFYFREAAYSITITALFATLLSFGIALFAWFAIRNYFKFRKKNELIKLRHYSFVRNTEIYQFLASKRSKYSQYYDESEIVLFESGALDPLELVIVTNPLCKYCRELHHMINQIVERNYENLKVKVRFKVNPNYLTTRDYKMCHRLLEIYHSGDAPRSGSTLYFKDAFDQAFGAMTSFEWLQKYGESSNLNYGPILENSFSWCMNNDVSFTPTIVLDGREFPVEYQPGDLIHMIEGIIDAYLESQQEELSRQISELQSSSLQL